MILLSTCRLSRTGTYPDKQKILHKSTPNCPGNYVAIGPHCGRPMIVNSRSALVALASISLWTIISGVSPSSPKRQKVVNGREIEGHEWRGSGRLSGRSRWLGTLVPSFLEYQAPNIISDNPLRRVLGPWKNIGKKGLLAAAFLHTHSHQSQLSFSVGFFYSLGHSIILRGWMICLCLGPLSLLRNCVFVEAFIPEKKKQRLASKRSRSTACLGSRGASITERLGVWSASILVLALFGEGPEPMSLIPCQGITT